VKACPYGSIYWNEELEIPQKCTFCAHLLDQGWKEPRCVEVCPTQALRFGKRAEFVNVIAEAEQLHPEYRRRPSVYYIGLPKTFIAGTVYCNDSNDCIEGAKVLLIKKPEVEVFTTVTDNYGDFEFEGFKAGSTYSLKIEVEGYHPVIIEDIFNEKDIYLGDIYLRKKVR
jgi:NAD-dependent dihydropyrimidine dehydrogenase PreA subunit